MTNRATSFPHIARVQRCHGESSGNAVVQPRVGFHARIAWLRTQCVAWAIVLRNLDGFLIDEAVRTNGRQQNFIRVRVARYNRIGLLSRLKRLRMLLMCQR